MKPFTSFARLLPLIGLFALPVPAMGAPPITVGDGTAPSCTAEALENALAIAGGTGGGKIRFKCGADPVTIALTATITLPNNTMIDGGGVITLTLIGTEVLAFSVVVPPDTTVVLKNLGYTGARSISNAGTLTITNNRFFRGGQGIDN